MKYFIKKFFVSDLMKKTDYMNLLTELGGDGDVIAEYSSEGEAVEALKEYHGKISDRYYYHMRLCDVGFYAVTRTEESELPDDLDDISDGVVVVHQRDRGYDVLLDRSDLIDTTVFPPCVVNGLSLKVERRLCDETVCDSRGDEHEVASEKDLEFMSKNGLSTEGIYTCSVELVDNGFDDNTFKGTLNECVDFLHKNKYDYYDAKIALVQLDYFGCAEYPEDFFNADGKLIEDSWDNDYIERFEFIKDYGGEHSIKAWQLYEKLVAERAERERTAAGETADPERAANGAASELEEIEEFEI